MRQTVPRGRRLFGTLALGALLAAAGLAAQAPSDPLPSVATLVEEARDRLLHPSRERGYLYTEKETSWSVAEDGTRTIDGSKTYQIYDDWGEGFRLLIAEDGEPLPPERIERQRREHLLEIRRRRHRLATESEEERQDRLEEAREDREEYEKTVDDVFRMFEIEPLGRELIEGRPAIEIRITPKPGVEPLSEQGEVFSKVRGRVWLDEATFELVRVAIEVTDRISYAWGLAARLDEGTTFTYARRLVDGRVWLPSRMHLQATGRVLLLKGLAIDRVSEYSGYQRIDNGHPLEANY